MNITFFNVQRLGEGTADSRRKTIVDQATRLGVDAYIMCELTTTCKYPPAKNVTHRVQNSSQLCYGGIYKSTTALNITRAEPKVTAAYRDALGRNFYAGGSEFRNLVDRGLGQVQPPATLGTRWPSPQDGPGGVDLYCFHAPANRRYAEPAVAFLACWLEDAYKPQPSGAPAPGRARYYLVVGDMNLEPEELEESKIYTVNKLKNQIANPGKATHRSSRMSDLDHPQKERELDWALTNIENVEVIAPWGFLRSSASDHIPIVVKY
ncbi:MAG: hypothetical protein HOV83_10855 [Catenulispora sp.]|nr:hypothetical protein [Catenulispora sp.]